MKVWDRVTISWVKNILTPDLGSLLGYEDILGISVYFLYTYKVVPDQVSISFNDLGKGIQNRCTDF